MIRTGFRRVFCNTQPQPQPRFDFALIRWICIYPWTILSGIFYYEYHQERKTLQALAHDMHLADPPAAVLQAQEVFRSYPEISKLTAEGKEKLRAACIQEGVPPQYFNEFTKKLESETSLNAIIREACQDPASPSCSHFHLLAKILSS